MITLTLSNGDIIKFNLNDFDREKSLRNAWVSMRDTEQYAEKKIKVTTDKGTALYKIGDIKNCVFDESRLVQGSVSTEKPKSPDPEPDPIDSIIGKMDDYKKTKLKKFIAIMESKGIKADPNNPDFMYAVNSFMSGL